MALPDTAAVRAGSRPAPLSVVVDDREPDAGVLSALSSISGAILGAFTESAAACGDEG